MENLKKATLGAGCFWCIEAIFKEMKGVFQVMPGYTGGHIKNPEYREVCTGRTGHAEVAQISYDPEVTSFEEILEVFFATHDPTTLNRQGNDVGTQYRSEIFAHDEEQYRIAEQAIQAADESGTWSDPVVTQVSMIKDFYPAEDYHKNYYALNSEQGYCQYVIRPKLEKFKKRFADRLKT
ncbi:MAG: peptide-methionine (S)-S-oxide reductase MsrA [Flavobacteriales bacterium]|nr:peptide-methionine (S)-S-oxide reductase MsrA [Flavobacteriales bacterium]